MNRLNVNYRIMRPLKCCCFFIAICSVFLIVAGTGGSSDPPPEPCPEGDICWVMQSPNLETRKKVGENCSIIRITNERNDTEDSTTENPVGSGGNSTDNSTAAEVEPPEEMVIDECQDEENRSFMECVLNYNPNITENDPDYHKGVCMCYRDWSINSNRSPAYNHSLNFTQESHEWFFFSDRYNECIVRSRKRCAPGGTQIVPYRCEDLIDPDTNKTREGLCSDSDVDPHFMTCGGRRSKILMTPLAVVATISFNVIRVYFETYVIQFV